MCSPTSFQGFSLEKSPGNEVDVSVHWEYRSLLPVHSLLVLTTNCDIRISISITVVRTPTTQA